MAKFEYKVVPAPKRGVKARGVKGPEEQFAHALTLLMNEAAAEGWEYQRTDTLPCEERKGLTGKTTVFQNMLVFRRTIEELEEAAEPEAPVLLVAPPEQPQTDVPAPDVDAGTTESSSPKITLPEASPMAPAIPAPDPRIAASLTPAAGQRDGTGS